MKVGRTLKKRAGGDTAQTTSVAKLARVWRFGWIVQSLATSATAGSRFRAALPYHYIRPLLSVQHILAPPASPMLPRLLRQAR
ncbi:hypothetical protein UC8_40590 [Roseimaritima ulvae]|uniref:Uncharacterized protein n=1 Tax=Roseimaritima ulvae TaxID=980254 RepID=A0A5B9QW72_9BACT|nr:hypothetical protein UC8_40590 [Roseimaritima ulvae]